MSTPEAKAFREASGILVECLQNPEILGWKLYSKNLIGKEVRDKTTMMGRSREEKCMAIVESLEKLISIDPKTFHDFLAVLEKGDDNLELHKQLKMFYNEIKKKTEKGQRSNAPGMGVMESHMPGLRATLQYMKSLKPNTESDKRIEVIEILKSFVEKSMQGGAKIEEVKTNLTELYRQDLLLNEPEYGWALSNADELEQARKMFEKETKNNSSRTPKRKQPRQCMFTKETVYYASLCCLTVSNCDSSNYLDFLKTKHPHHEFSEASLSRTREGEVDRYLVVKEGKTYYIAFKGEHNLMEWKKKYGSFEEGIQVQCSRIPLRFFVQQINDGFSIVLTGFSFGGLLACSLAANLCCEPYLTSDQISSNVVCITFGQPLINISSVLETAQQIPVLNSILHNVLMEKDILPKLLKFLENGFGAMQAMIATDDQMVQNPFSSLILQYLSEIQNAYHQSTDGAVSSTCSKTLEDMKELLIEVLSQKTALTNGAATEVSSIGHFYMITNLKFQWSEVSEKQCSTLHKISSDQISSIQVDNICKPSISDYYNGIIRGYLEETPVYSLPPRYAINVTEMPLLKPSITNVSFHQHGKELAVVIEGNNFWFCTKVHVSSIPHIKIEPENISCKTIQFNYMPKDESDIPEGDTIGVQLFSHFSNPIRKPNIPVKRKVYRFTYRQEQLAKHTPSELIELAYMSALLERHPFSDSEPLSNRFRVLRSFLEDIVHVVPIESVPYTIASADDNLAGPCCRALIHSKISLPPSACMKVGMMRALHRLHIGEQVQINEAGLYYTESIFVERRRLEGQSEFRFDAEKFNVPESQPLTIDAKHYNKVFRNRCISMLKDNKRQKQSKSPGKPSVPLHYRLHGSKLSFNQYSMCLQGVESLYARSLVGYTTMLSPDHPNHQLLSQLSQIVPSPDTSMDAAICGLNIDLLYPPTGSNAIHGPLNILIFGRKMLSELVDQMSDQQPPLAAEVNSLSQLCNTQMLQTINEIRQQHVRLCTSLLGSFMEEQMQVPLKRTSFDTAQAIFSAVSVAAMGVWALFNLSYQDVNSLLSGMPNKQLFVQVKEYIRGMFSENTITLDREYAGKLQFMVQGLDKTVSCNSHYISYSLERQLVLLCDKLNISANTSTERIVDGWDTLFKDNVLAVVAISHRPLIARWMRWALMVHNLREELAKYTAIGVVGLVNSGKSKLVNSLFGIQVAVGTTECKRTTVPFLYNLDQVVEGLDVIDFPGVDDRDETIPDLAELLLSLAQVVIFVVDYRRVHTESVKHWLEHLEKDPVHVLVCLTHADQLYVEYMNEDGTHRPSDIVRREIKIQLDMIKEKLGTCPRHSVQLYSICQGKDSVLNTPEGRKVLKEVGIGMPQDVGDWLIKVLEKHLDQQELSERLKQYIYKDMEQQQTDEATALEEH